MACAREDFDADALEFLIDQLELLEKRMARIDRSVTDYVRQETADAPPPAKDPGSADVSIARQIDLADGIPGIGPVAAACLVFGARGVGRFVSGKALAAQWATCPERVVTGTSINKTRLTARGDHKRRAMLYLSTQVACMFDPAFAFHKWRMIRRGLRPQQAVCACMNRMARVIWALVAQNQEYDTNRMLEQIQNQHASLWKTFVAEHQNQPVLWKKVKPRFLNAA